MDPSRTRGRLFGVERMEKDVAGRDHTERERLQFLQGMLYPHLESAPNIDLIHDRRIVAGWRLTRAMAIGLGLIEPNESLDDLHDTVHSNDWHKPQEIRKTRTRFNKQWSGLCEAVERRYGQNAAVPLLPPGVKDVPVDPSTSDKTAELGPWLSLMAYFADWLGVGRTAYGAEGLMGMLEVSEARRLWPAPREMRDFERVLTNDILAVLLQYTEQVAFDTLEFKYGMLPKEGKAIISMVQGEAVRRNDAEIETKRAMIASRTDYLFQKAVDNGDIRTARWLLKDLSVVEGVARAETADYNTEAADFVAGLDAEETPRTDFAREDLDDDTQAGAG